MKTRINEQIKIAPSIWPGRQLNVQPGDLSQVMPKGIGLALGPVFFPWGASGSMAGRPSFYAWQPVTGNFLVDAPLAESGGGIVYFGTNDWNGPRWPSDFQAVLRLMGMEGVWDDRKYLAFLEVAEDPLRQRFLCQLRLLSKFALDSFGADLTPQTAHYADQPLTLGECLGAFIEDQKRELPECVLDQVMGGDGDNYEQLGFGLMVENSYHRALRIWSRAWIITK